MVTTDDKGLRSDATNAYDLLDDVCYVILAEPRRYNQEEWFTRSAARITDVLTFSAENGAPINTHLPACGTMACRAGWIVQLSSGVDGFLCGQDIGTVAATILRATFLADPPLPAYVHHVFELFDGSALDGIGWIGTPEYAAEGERGLRAFMARWETYLKSIPVTPR